MRFNYHCGNATIFNRKELASSTLAGNRQIETGLKCPAGAPHIRMQSVNRWLAPAPGKALLTSCQLAASCNESFTLTCEAFQACLYDLDYNLANTTANYY